MLCRLILLTALVTLFTACTTSASGAPQVTDDHEAQVRFEAARRTLAEIKDLKARGRTIVGECKTVELLFYQELKEHTSATARALAGEIKKTCKVVEPKE